MGVRAVFSREAVALPVLACAAADESGTVEQPGDGSLNCHGYGSTVAVTASFGMAAAGSCIEARVSAAGR
jgi:tRNA threonylcarbamoyladenosine dehydratase